MCWQTTKYKKLIVLIVYKRGNMNIILLGPPGCGKGTQAQNIVSRYDLTHISPGDFIREEIHKGSQIGKQIKETVSSGHMIDEKVVISLIQKHVTAKNYLLFDGIPRTLHQAKLLEELYEIDMVIDLQVSDAEVIRRISSRWAVEKNGEQFTFMDKESAENYADEFGGELFQRADDKPQVVQERLRVYHKETEPLIEHYGLKHKLYIVNGSKSVDNVWADIAKLLDKLHVKKKAERVRKHAL